MKIKYEQTTTTEPYLHPFKSNKAIKNITIKKKYFDESQYVAIWGQ